VILPRRNGFLRGIRSPSSFWLLGSFFNRHEITLERFRNQLFEFLHAGEFVYVFQSKAQQKFLCCLIENRPSDYRLTSGGGDQFPFEKSRDHAAERLQKIIAAAGIVSRRKAEELISAGQVSVNGQIVTELGTKADPERDHIRVNGKLLKGPERHVYLLMNKPK